MKQTCCWHPGASVRTYAGSHEGGLHRGLKIHNKTGGRLTPGQEPSRKMIDAFDTAAIARGSTSENSCLSTLWVKPPIRASGTFLADHFDYRAKRLDSCSRFRYDVGSSSRRLNIFDRQLLACVERRDARGKIRLNHVNLPVSCSTMPPSVVDRRSMLVCAPPPNVCPCHDKSP